MISPETKRRISKAWDAFAIFCAFANIPLLLFILVYLLLRLGGKP